MSLAEDFSASDVVDADGDSVTWAGLSRDAKRRAVLDRLAAGHSVQEAAVSLSVVYGAIGANHVRGVIHREGLDDDPAVVDARRARRADELRAAASRAGARVKGRGDACRLPVPKMPEQKLGRRRGKGNVTVLELRDWHCKAPAWSDDAPASERFFCAARTEPGETYCPACRARMYRPASAPRRVAVRGGAR